MYLERDQPSRIGYEAAFLVALSAVINLLAVISQESQPNMPVFVLGIFAAGLLSGMMVSPLLGRKGGLGFILAALGFWLATLITGALVGTAIAPGIGTILGATYSAMIFTEGKTFWVWIACMIVTHVSLQKVRQIKGKMAA